MTLTQDAAAIARTYADDGFVSPLDVMPLQEAARWRDAYEDAEKVWRAVDDPVEQRILKGFPHYVFPEIRAMLHDDRIIDQVVPILGDDILVWNCTFWTKEPNSGSFVSWHQDLNYWGLDDVDEVTAWVALSPAMIESGCMRFLKGSHRERLGHRDTFADDNMLTRGQEIDAQIDESKAFDVELQPGQMSLHHGLLAHASGPNTSDDRRIGLAIRYIKPSMKQAGGERDFAIHVRGEDRYNNFELVPMPKASLDPDGMDYARRATELHHQILFRGAADKIPGAGSM